MYNIYVSCNYKQTLWLKNKVWNKNINKFPILIAFLRLVDASIKFVGFVDIFLFLFQIWFLNYKVRL